MNNMKHDKHEYMNHETLCSAGFGGPARSLKVSFECGATEEMNDVI